MSIIGRVCRYFAHLLWHRTAFIVEYDGPMMFVRQRCVKCERRREDWLGAP